MLLLPDTKLTANRGLSSCLRSVLKSNKQWKNPFNCIMSSLDNIDCENTEMLVNLKSDQPKEHLQAEGEGASPLTHMVHYRHEQFLLLQFRSKLVNSRILFLEVQHKDYMQKTNSTKCWGKVFKWYIQSKGTRSTSKSILE